MAKMLKNIQREIQHKGRNNARKPKKSQASPSISPLNMSSIEKASFLEDDEILTYGNPLHSTALEDDLSPNPGPEAERSKAALKTAGGKVGGDNRARAPRRPSRKVTEQNRGKTSAPQPSASSVQKENQPQAQRKSPSVKSKTRALQREQTNNTDSSAGPTAQDPPPKKSQGATKTVRVKRATRKAVVPALPKKKPVPAHSEVSTPALSQETAPSRSSVTGAGESAMESEPEPSGSVATAVPTRRRRVSSLSSEDLTDEDPSWQAEQDRGTSGSKVREKRKSSSRSSSGRHKKAAEKKRKPSPGSSSDTGPSNKNKRQERDTRNPIDLDVVLDAFQEFVSQYISEQSQQETIESGPVRRAIDALSKMFEDHLTELITNTKELNSLKKENMKVNRTINRKRGRLVEIKNELIMKETQLRRMQKEQKELLERLTDLRKGTTFLYDLRDLLMSYRAHRQKHPEEVEAYGPSSLPALLLEARGVLGTEHQLKNINDSLQQVLDQAGQP
ncbi:hypothetical protein AGOR_G00232710 [Albula goreensis]|uniref:Centromere protein U n=1 Tax=Albula goreensis TaxID=1534307 RepID=A0A8T3CHZ7_9TELE|nr:hypothetical protein AGOR_G00232710 [Albula goreensis]